MEVTPVTSQLASAPTVTTRSVPPEQVAARRELIKATHVINNTQALGAKNELIFILDNANHRAILRVIDRDTKEVVMQVPPDYVLSLAQSISQETPFE